MPAYFEDRGTPPAPARFRPALPHRRGPSGVTPLSKRLLTMVLVGLATAVPLAGLELTARVLTHFDVVQYWKPIRIVWTPGTEDYRLAHLTMDEYLQPDPVLIWKPWAKPPYNGQRFKGPLMAVPKPPGVFRIMLYGDSNTDGPDRGGWPAQLQRILEERTAGGGLRFEVVNAGVAGYSSHQGLLRFEQEVGTYRPDLVTVSFGWNDAAEIGAGRPDRDYQPSAARVRVLRLLLKSRLYLVLMRYLQPTKPAAEIRGYTPRVALPDYLQDMERFADVAARRGALVVFLTRPHREPEAKLRQVSNWEREVPEYNSRLRLWARDRALPLVDVQSTFERAGAAFFVDNCHFTEAGHQRMAETLLEELAGRGLIPGVVPRSGERSASVAGRAWPGAPRR
jgi:lysophospholipase L1-like esterase